jgi:hypothetical protein
VWCNERENTQEVALLIVNYVCKHGVDVLYIVHVLRHYFLAEKVLYIRTIIVINIREALID